MKVTTIYCDACGQETGEKNLEYLTYKTQIDQIMNKDASHYVDNNWNVITGKTNTLELCRYCYNRIMLEALNKLFQIKENSK